MLVKVTVGNYLSINEKITLSLEAESLKELFHESNTIEVKNAKLLKSISLYGLNSSGKSNLIKALGFIKEFILNSFKELQANEEIEVERFKFLNSTHKFPSYFEVEFIQNDTRYRYGFEVDKKIVHSEWLYYTIKNTEKNYFIRKFQDFEISPSFLEGNKGGGINITRSNALFLSVLAQLNGSISTQLIQWFQNVTYISDTNFNYFIEHTANLIERKPKIKNLLSKILESARIGFSEVKITTQNIDDSFFHLFAEDVRKILISKNSSTLKIETIHPIYDHNGNTVGNESLDLRRDESLGTQKFFALAGCIVDAIIEGKVLIIDELDSRLHPELSSGIIKLFNNASDNYHGAQLIFSSHNTNILSNKILRRDQVYVVSKNRINATQINSLYNLKIRNDASYEKELLRLSKDGENPQLNIFSDF
jgi:AAA15 family ATPase/GTPase